MIIEEILAASTVARATGAGEWQFEEDPPVTLLYEMGQSLVDLERVSKLTLRGTVAVVVTARETHYLPADRFVGLKIASASPSAAGKRAGFI